MGVQISVNLKDFEDKLKKLDGIKNGSTQAFVGAMNKTVTGMRTIARKEMQKNYHLQKSGINGKFKVTKASEGNLRATLRSKGRPIGLIKFNTTPNTNPGKSGGAAAFANVNKNNPGGHIEKFGRKAFIATVKNKKSFTGVFLRTGKSKTVKLAVRKKKGSRLKMSFSRREVIKHLYSVGVAQMLDGKEANKNIRAESSKRLGKELDKQIKKLLAEN